MQRDHEECELSMVALRIGTSPRTVSVPEVKNEVSLRYRAKGRRWAG